MIRIERTGLATTVQDRGRRGWSHVGVGRSGAADMAAHDLANRLVGNPPGAATLETSGGLRWTVLAPVLMALSGAPCLATVTNGPTLGHCAPQSLPEGADVGLGSPEWGLRTYVAVRGGFDVPLVLGSCARDTLGGLGGHVERATVLTCGRDPLTPIAADLAPTARPSSAITVEPGPRLDWFDDDAWSVLCGQEYAVEADTNRIGARLRGAVALRRTRVDELPSEGLVLGAVQVPPDGQPTVMLADHPVTGGYPVIAVIADGSLAAVAQARPGTTLRFSPARRSGR